LLLNPFHYDPVMERSNVHSCNLLYLGDGKLLGGSANASRSSAILADSIEE
jgi:hypothetical protein